jgi:hypothetical protein
MASFWGEKEDICLSSSTQNDAEDRLSRKYGTISRNKELGNKGRVNEGRNTCGKSHKNSLAISRHSPGSTPNHQLYWERRK